MKTDTPRIVAVASDIAAAQKRRTEIDRRVVVLDAELTKLAEERAKLNNVQGALAREMDKLTGSSSVAP